MSQHYLVIIRCDYTDSDEIVECESFCNYFDAKQYYDLNRIGHRKLSSKDNENHKGNIVIEKKICLILEERF